MALFCFLRIQHVLHGQKKSCYGKLIWKTRAPLNVRFFMWLAINERYLAADNLQKRGGLINKDAGYARGLMRIVHTFFVSCVFTNRVWRFLSWVNISLQLPGDIFTEITTRLAQQLTFINTRNSGALCCAGRWCQWTKNKHNCAYWLEKITNWTCKHDCYNMLKTLSTNYH